MSEQSNHRGLDPDDILARSILAVQGEDDAPGPSEQTRDKTLAAIREASSAPARSPHPFIKKVTDMTLVHKIAVTVAITSGGMIFWFVFSMFSGLSGVSYGQVADQIRAARTMSFTQTFVLPDNKEQFVSKLLFKEPGRLRVESSRLISIIDTGAHKALSLLPESKRAQLVTLQNVPTTQSDKGGPLADTDTVAQFRKLADVKGTQIADRQVNGVKGKGFEAQVDGHTYSMWVDPKTGVPLVVEFSIAVGDKAATVTLTDITFDKELDDAMFSLTPPPGYAVQSSQVKVKPDVEGLVISILQAYSAKTHGKLPARLDDWGDYAQVAAAGSTDGKLDAQSTKMLSEVGALNGTLFSKTKGKDFDYVPRDATLGDAHKMVFWYRLTGNAGYRAIYADLHAADVSEADLVGK